MCYQVRLCSCLTGDEKPRSGGSSQFGRSPTDSTFPEGEESYEDLPKGVFRSFAGTVYLDSPSPDQTLEHGRRDVEVPPQFRLVEQSEVSKKPDESPEV